jgi:hypothetical protein
MPRDNIAAGALAVNLLESNGLSDFAELKEA